MPQRADVTPALNLDIDIDETYVAELLSIDEAPSQFDNARDGAMSMTWKFRLYNQQTGAAVIDLNNGDAYELWNFSTDTTYFNPKTGKKAKAREWTEALVGRELDDDEMNELIDLGFAESLQGKRALAVLEWYTTKKGDERLRIIKLRQLKKTQAAVPASDEPVSKSNTDRVAGDLRAQDVADKAARRARLGLDDAA